MTQERDPLQLDRCPECGYLLTGLPEEGCCPECGFRYDPSMVVLWGWARRVRANGLNTRHMIGGWVRGCLLILLVSVLWGAMVATAGPVNSVPLLLVLAITILMVVSRVYRRRRLLEDRPAPVQLQVVPEGFGQRDGIGPVVLQRWDGRMRLYVRYSRSGYCQFRSYTWYSIWPGWDQGGEVIDFEWRCNRRTAQRLQRRVEALFQAGQQHRKIHRLCRKNRLSPEEAERQVRQIQEDMRCQGFWRRGQT